jgi:hypothetical protein
VEAGFERVRDRIRGTNQLTTRQARPTVNLTDPRDPVPSRHRVRMYVLRALRPSPRPLTGVDLGQRRNGASPDFTSVAGQGYWGRSDVGEVPGMQEAPVCVRDGAGFHVPGDGPLSARSGEGWLRVSGLHDCGGFLQAGGDAGGDFEQSVDELVFRGFPGQEQVTLSGAGNDFAGGCEQPVAPAFDVSSLGLVAAGEGGELEPGDEVGGQVRRTRGRSDADPRPGIDARSSPTACPTYDDPAPARRLAGRRQDRCEKRKRAARTADTSSARSERQQVVRSFVPFIIVVRTVT